MAELYQTNAQLTTQIAQLLQQWTEREQQFKEWLAGSATGGPNGDGSYPLSAPVGPASMVMSPAKLADLVVGPAGIAAGHADDASQSAAQAANSAAQAQIDREAISGVREAAEAARDLSLNYKSQTEWLWSQVLNYHGQIQQNTTDFLQARDDTLAAHAETLTARDDSLVAKAAALAARDLAQSYAASINPATLATKAEVADAVAAVVGSSQATLDTLAEIGAALGNDPNFATTMTNQLAGKAPLSHTHTTAQITGLDTALAGKAALSHTHPIADVVGLQTALDGKAAAGHTHSYLPLAGGTLSGALVIAGGGGTNGLSGGNGDGASYTTHNLAMNIWWGLAMKSYDGAINGFYDARTGTWDVKGDYRINGSSVKNTLAAKADLSGATFTGAVNFPGGTLSGKLVAINNDNNAISNGQEAQARLEVRGNGTGAAMIPFHRPGAYAAFLGLDTDNKWKVGGWSMGAVAYELWHGGNFNPVNKVDRVSGNRPGVTRLYRRDDDSGFNVQTNWTGAYWHLRGYAGDTFHAECYVERAGSCGWSDSSGNSDTVDGLHGWQLVPKGAILCAGVATVSGGVVTRRSDKNVASITRVGVGKYTVTVSSALPSYYVVVTNCDGDAAEGYRMSAQAYSRGTGSFSLSFYHISDTPNPYDPVYFDFLVVDAGQL